MHVLCLKQIAVVFLCLLALAFIACGGGGGGGEDDGNNTGGTPIQLGQWSGDTPFGRIVFELTSGSTNLQECTVIFSGYACGSSIHSGSIQKTWNPPLLIQNGQMNVEIDLGATSGAYLSIDGAFNKDGNAVNGNFALYAGQNLCNGAWTASPVQISSDVVIEWVDRSGPDEPLITFQYAGGILIKMIFHQNFHVISGNGNIQFTVSVKDEVGDVTHLGERSETFSVEEGLMYELIADVSVSSFGRCDQTDTDVMVFSSSSVATTSHITIYPGFNLDWNWFECAGRYAVSDLRVQRFE